MSNSQLSHSRKWIGGCLLLSLLTVGRGDSSVHGDDPIAAPPPVAELQLKVFPLETTDAAEARELLGNLLPKVTVNADPRTNSLFMRGTSEELQNAEALLQVLDQAASEAGNIELEFACIEQSVAGPPAGEPAWSEVDPNALLEGSATLEGSTTRSDFRLRVVHQQEASLQIGGIEAVVEGRTAAPGRGGLMSTSYHRDSVGTLISATAALRSSGTIDVELTYETSQYGPPVNPETPAPKRTLVAKTTVQLQPGVAAVVGGSQSQSIDGSGVRQSRTILVLRAKPAP